MADHQKISKWPIFVFLYIYSSSAKLEMADFRHQVVKPNEIPCGRVLGLFSPGCATRRNPWWGVSPPPFPRPHFARLYNPAKSLAGGLNPLSWASFRQAVQPGEIPRRNFPRDLIYLPPNRPNCSYRGCRAQQPLLSSQSAHRSSAGVHTYSHSLLNAPQN